MAYCPQCLTEYEEGSPECIDCHVALAPGPLPKEAEESTDTPAKLARVRTFSGPTAHMDAILAKNILEAEGIPSLLPGEFSAEALPGVDMVQLLVREEDATEAAEILESFLDHPPETVASDE